MIYSYKFASESAKALSEALGVKRIKHENSKFVGSPDKIVINWGASNMPSEVEKCKIVNHPSLVRMVSDKLKFFNKVKDEVNIPPYTTDYEEALGWSKNGDTVLGRTILNGHSGEGISIFEDTENLEKLSQKSKDAIKVYTKYIPKKDEYRVHVVNGEVIDIRRKALKNGTLKKFVNWKVRNHKGGFIYAKEGFDAPEEVLKQAVKALVVSGLNFGAVDVIWNNFHKKAYVLEINTAPGIEGSTVENYKEAFQDLFYGKEKDVMVLVGAGCFDSPPPPPKNHKEFVFNGNAFQEILLDEDEDDDEDYDDDDLEF